MVFFFLVDNSHVYVPVLENTEARKNNLTFDQPSEKMRSGMPRDKESKVDCTANYFSKKKKIRVEISSTDFLNYFVIFVPQFGWARDGKKVDKILFNTSAFANIMFNC